MKVASALEGLMCIYNAISIILRWKKFYSMLAIVILRNSSQSFLGVLQNTDTNTNEHADASFGTR